MLAQSLAEATFVITGFTVSLSYFTCITTESLFKALEESVATSLTVVNFPAESGLTVPVQRLSATGGFTIAKDMVSRYAIRERIPLSSLQIAVITSESTANTVSEDGERRVITGFLRSVLVMVNCIISVLEAPFTSVAVIRTVCVPVSFSNGVNEYTDPFTVSSAGGAADRVNRIESISGSLHLSLSWIEISEPGCPVI